MQLQWKASAGTLSTFASTLSLGHPVESWEFPGPRFLLNPNMTPTHQDMSFIMFSFHAAPQGTSSYPYCSHPPHPTPILSLPRVIIEN